ncbi:MAG: HDIG domain-containing protein [bacterium]|jgi:putative nucleotidyltransferase with HDIG domain
MSQSDARVILHSTLASPDSPFAFEELDRRGILTVAIPELEAARDCVQNEFHHKPVLAHTLEAMAHLEMLLRNVDAAVASIPFPENIVSPYYARIRESLAAPIGGSDSHIVLRLAMLLHDIDKPATSEKKANGRITFYGHDVRGAQTARAISHRLGLSESAADAVALLVRHHLRLGFLERDAGSDLRLVRRFIRALGSLVPHEILLSLADRLASRGKAVTQEQIDAHFKIAARVLAEYYEPAPVIPPLLSGDEIMTALGIPEGPEVGRLQNAVEEARARREIRTKRAAIALIRKLTNK